jgi:hypothetical protein
MSGQDLKQSENDHLRHSLNIAPSMFTKRKKKFLNISIRSPQRARVHLWLTWRDNHNVIRLTLETAIESTTLLSATLKSPGELI